MPNCDESLFAALAKHPRHTAGSESHPMPDRCRIEDLFDWEAIAKEMGRSEEELMNATFGPACGKRQARCGLLRARGSPEQLKEAAMRAQLGIVVVPDFVKEEEEAAMLAEFLDPANAAGLPWEKREGGGWHASFGPSFIPNAGYKVDRSKAFTELPRVLDTVRSRLHRLLRFEGDAEGSAVRSALQHFAMSPATRSGRQGQLSQAFLQRYELNDEEEICNRTQALGMHFDSRNANAEAVIGLNLGEDHGHIFFSRSGPHKGQPFPMALAKELEARGEGILVELPRRALYMFFGFARYHLRHGVPWSHPTGPYRRVTVTLRSVPLPTAKRGARRAAEAATHEPDAAKRKQRKLMDVLSSFEHPRPGRRLFAKTSMAASAAIDLCSDEEE
ncbi:Glucose-6-phosphate 1-dehydrogenase, partial [Durusdinium trenchii]